MENQNSMTTDFHNINSPNRLKTLLQIPASTISVPLKEHERIDDLQRNGFHIIQNTQKFCFGMDAVLLSGFAKIKPNAKVLDLGTGTGIIPILWQQKQKRRILQH